MFESLVLRGRATAPTIDVGSGAGTSPTISLNGTDIAGMITLTSGTLPTLSATICTITFTNAFSSAPYMIISPANAAASLLSGVSMIIPGVTTTVATVTAGTTALAALTVYKWVYHTIG